MVYPGSAEAALERDIKGFLLLVSSTEKPSSASYCAHRHAGAPKTARCLREMKSERGSRRIQQPDKDGIDDLGLLKFLGRIDHIVPDLHGLWKVYRGKLEQSPGTPQTDQLPRNIVADSIIVFRGQQPYILDSRWPVKPSSKGRHAETKKLAE